MALTKKKITADLKLASGHFPLYRFDIITVVGFPAHGLKLKLAVTDSFESWKRSTSVFLTYLCHHDYKEILYSQYEGF